MEIERINENTVKFFLSYIDIEERGFTREEVWYNREKSEELFWDMMDEINEEAEFEVEGPLWIQVHAMNNGIEVTVTRAQPNDGQMGESPFEQHDSKRMFQQSEDDGFLHVEDIMPGVADEPAIRLENMFEFKEFEDVIHITSRMTEYIAQTSLYSYENKYFLHIVYDDQQMNEQEKTNMYYILTEFGKPSKMTIHILKEYGTVVMESDVFNQIQKYF